MSVDDDYGRNGITQFLYEAEANGVCIAFHKTLPTVLDITAYEKLGESLFCLFLSTW